MQIVKKQTEQVLKKILKIMEVEGTAYRCMAFYTSKLNGLEDDWFETFQRALKAHFDEPGLRVFICFDNDIFILTRHTTQKKMNSFVDSLKPLALPFNKGEATLFEVGFTTQLQRIMQAKIRVKAERDAQESMNQIPSKPVSNITQDDLKIEGSYIATINQRREARPDLHVMVIEDDLFTQKIVGKAIKASCEVFAVDTAQKGFLLYAKQAPNIVFLDIGLPDMDGLSVLQKLQKIDKNAFIVMLSGNGNKENILKAIQNGAKGFVGKPFTADKINHYIDQYHHQNDRNVTKEAL